MKALLFLALCSSCFAFFPHEVALVVNSSSTMDTDANGVADWRDIVLYYKEWRPTWDTTLVCSLQTFDPTPSSEEDIPLSFIHYDLDTTTRYGEAAAIGKNGAHDYLLQELCNWFDTNSKWSKIKCVCLVMGMPLRTQHNSTYSASCGGGSYPLDSTVIWSVDNLFAVFAHPGLEDNGSWDLGWALEDAWQSSYFTTRYNTTDWAFYPGIYSFAEAGSHGANNSTVYQWITTCRLDGFSVDHVRSMIRKAASSTGFTWNGTSFVTSNWGLVDQDSATAASVFSRPFTAADFPTALTNFQAAFGSNIYWDAGASGLGGGTGSGGSIPDTIETVWGRTGGRAVSNPIQFYFTNGGHSTPDLGGNYWWQLQFPIANGAICITPESFACWSVRDTVTRGDNQGMIAEAIANGFTYGIGSVCEPTTALIPTPEYLLKGLTLGYMDIARAAQMATRSGQMKLYVALGDPCGNIGRAYPVQQSGGASSRTWGGGGWR